MTQPRLLFPLQPFHRYLMLLLYPLFFVFFFPIIRNQQYIKGFPPYLDTASQTCPSPPHLLGQLILVKTPKKPFTPDLSSKRVSLEM